jgi:general secretion pathway protein M
MKAWWARQGARDRAVMSIGGAFIALALGWAFLWFPLAASRDALALRVAGAEADLAWMRSVEPELARARDGGSASGLDRAGRSLLALADGTAREAGLGGTLVRIEPVGAGRVTLWFERVPFDAMVIWLESLDARFGVRVDELSVERTPDTGAVNARVGVVEASGPG